MTMTLGGVTLVEPDVPAEVEQIMVGQHSEAHDGTLVTDYTALKWRWSLKWSCLTLAEFTAIKARAAVVTSQALVLPFDAGPYTVVVRQDTLKFRAEPNEDYFHIEFDVEEAS